ncbi:MAG: MerR family transcriptional regulator [Acidobacteriota bacterium]
MRMRLDQIKEVQYVGVKELADAAGQILKERGSSQEKGTVTEYPNERTIRFYLTEGLLPPSEMKQGNASVFGYSHLLTLLVIKHLQSDGLPITIIRQLVTGKAPAELEELLGAESVGVKVITDPAELQTTLSKSEAELTELYGEPVRKIEDQAAINEYLKSKRGGAKEYLKSLLSPRKQTRDGELPAFSLAQAEPKPDRTILRSTDGRTPSPKAVESWSRHEIVPGAELHIRQGYKPPVGDEEAAELLRKIKEALGFQNDT